MKVIFDNDGNIIKIRGKGAVLVLDKGDSIYSDLCDTIRNQARELDVPFKLGAFSCKEELSNVEGLDERIRGRGRFIAPLIEGFFQKLPDKEYDLIILHSGYVYDLRDFNNELSSKFGKIIIKDVNMNPSFTMEQWGNLLREEAFNFYIDNVSSSISSPSVPYEWDNNFFSLSLDVTQGRFVLTRITGETAGKIDIDLKIRGKPAKANIEVIVNGSKFEGMLKNDEIFNTLSWRSLPNEDIEIFKRHLKKYKEYKESNFNLPCPVCREEHDFQKPFFCDRQEGGDALYDPFSQGRPILECVKGSQGEIILFQSEGDRIEFLLTERKILEFGALRFVFISKNPIHVYEVRCRDDSLEITEAVKIYNHLYELRENKVILLVN